MTLIYDINTLNISFERKYSRSDVENFLNQYGLKGSYQLIQGYSDEVVKHWNVPLHILFIDGDHNYEAIRQDFRDWTSWLIHNGIVVVHDSNMGKDLSMAGFYGPTQIVEEFIVNSPYWKIIERFSSVTVAQKIAG